MTPPPSIKASWSRTSKKMSTPSTQVRGRQAPREAQLFLARRQSNKHGSAATPRLDNSHRQ